MVLSAATACCERVGTSKAAESNVRRQKARDGSRMRYALEPNHVGRTMSTPLPVCCRSSATDEAAKTASSTTPFAVAKNLAAQWCGPLSMGG